MSDNLVERALAFVKAVEGGATGPALAAFYHPEVRQTEYPNLLTHATAERSLADLLEGALRGQKVLQKQRYVVRNTVASGNQVVLEAEWFGTLAIPLGKLRPGDDLRAYFAQVFEFKDGLIFRQRNYDCFESFV